MPNLTSPLRSTPPNTHHDADRSCGRCLVLRDKSRLSSESPAPRTTARMRSSGRRADARSPSRSLSTLVDVSSASPISSVAQQTLLSRLLRLPRRQRLLRLLSRRLLVRLLLRLRLLRRQSVLLSSQRTHQLQSQRLRLRLRPRHLQPKRQQSSRYLLAQRPQSTESG